MIIPRLFSGLLLLLALGGLGGCATTGGNPSDPLEGLNRVMFSFNDGADKLVIKPLAIGYKTVLPTFARTGVTNFFANLGDIWIGINNVLQGKIAAGAGDFGRFALNSTVGILGFFDVASNAGLEKHDEDFGQTLGRWGVGSGAYLVLPFLGPSSFRDGLSRLLVDWRGNPLWYTVDVPTGNALLGVSLIDSRANLLGVSQLAEEAALDYYSYVRGAYLQRRRSQIYDGDPPRERDRDQSLESVPGTGPAIQAEADMAPAGFAARPVEAPVAGTNGNLGSAQESSAVGPQQVTVLQTTGGVSPGSYDPSVPRNYDAVLAISGEPRTSDVASGQKP